MLGWRYGAARVHTKGDIALHSMCSKLCETVHFGSDRALPFSSCVLVRIRSMFNSTGCGHLYASKIARRVDIRNVVANANHQLRLHK